MTTSAKKLTNAERADIALGDLTSNGGILTPEQSTAFVDMIVETPTILSQVRRIPMSTPEKKVSRMGFGARVLRAARQAGGANDDGSNDRYVRAADRVKPSFSQISMQTSEVIAEIHIPYEVLEDNIEGQSFETHVMRQIAQRTALDLEELALWGDKTSADPFLALQDGYMKRMAAHIYNNGGNGVNPNLFANALLTLPQRYLRNVNQMKAFVSEANKIQYMQYLQGRGTAMGDQAIQGNIPLISSGLRVEGAASLALGPTGTTGKGLVTPPENLLFGIQREISIESEKDIRSRMHIVVVTARVAFQVDDVDAGVRLDNIGGLADASLPVKVTNASQFPA